MLSFFQLGPTAYGKFEKGLPAAVNTLENKAPQAVGITAQSSMDMYMSARRGKGITILQVYRDHLWELGSKSPPPAMGPAFSEPVPQSAESENFSVHHFESLNYFLSEQEFTCRYSYYCYDCFFINSHTHVICYLGSGNTKYEYCSTTVRYPPKNKVLSVLCGSAFSIIVICIIIFHVKKQKCYKKKIKLRKSSIIILQT